MPAVDMECVALLDMQFFTDWNGLCPFCNRNVRLEQPFTCKTKTKFGIYQNAECISGHRFPLQIYYQEFKLKETSTDILA